MGYLDKSRGLIKKTAAVILGITMAFGALMLPCSNAGDGYVKASAADTVENLNCTYEYTLKRDKTIRIDNVTFTGDTVMIPSSIERDGKAYDVTEIGKSFLEGNDQIKRVVFPDSITVISSSVLRDSSVETILLSDDLEELGSDFASQCPKLRSVKYNGTRLRPGKVGLGIFLDSGDISNEKGAVCLGNWLLRYTADEGVTTVKPADLGTGDIKIEHLGKYALVSCENVSTFDLEGIRTIGDYCFYCCEKLTTLENADSIEKVGLYALVGTPWHDNAKESDFSRIGDVLIRYQTDSDTIDFTSGKLEGIKQVKKWALENCSNIDTIICTSDIIIEDDCIYKLTEEEAAGYTDFMPLECKTKIKKIIIDGEELTYSRMIANEKLCDWMNKNFLTLKGSVLQNEMLTNKTKELFRQMDIPYRGGCSGESVYTPAEEFYIRFKIHNYISEYNYDYEFDNRIDMSAYLLNGSLYCLTYAYLAHYLLECAGVGVQSLASDDHAWNNTRIGDEWFEFDDGWNAQGNSHSYVWFGLSSACVYDKDRTFHAFQVVHNPSDIGNPTEERMIAARTIGDIDGDIDRDKDDVSILWSYIKDGSASADNIEVTGDLNFDGRVDITDAVLIDQLVNSKALDLDKVPDDGFAPAVKIAFFNGTDYDNIQYLWTDREGYITLPDGLFEAPKGKKLSYDIGRAGQEVRITDPLTVVQVKWIDANTPDYRALGDVNSDGKTDIEDAVMVINHVNGQKALTDKEIKRADIDGNSDIDIEDAVAIISHVNGVKPIE